MKIVDKSCKEPLHSNVFGITCTNNYVCMAQQSGTPTSKLYTWQGIRIKQEHQKAKSVYRLCMCVGMCSDEDGWTMLPGELKVSTVNVYMLITTLRLPFVTPRLHA